jgi:hypothetical protein
MTERELLFVDFSRCEDGPIPDDWWVEGGESVRVEKGRLRVRADPGTDQAPGYVCTVWNRTPLPADVRVEFDACVIDSSIDANNVNFFLHYADPSGRPLFETRASRADAGYAHYHVLDGYIFTFLNDADGSAGRYDDGSTKARLRMRRCPGFHLVDETYGYHCRKGTVYHVDITVRKGRLTYAVDGTEYLWWVDRSPLPGGLLGLRTYRTELWWNDIRVVPLD